jgi:hypothetical protein
MRYLKLYEQYNQPKSLQDFQIIRELGAGMNGATYLLNNGHVLKVTQSESEYESTEYAYDCQLQHTPVIYDLGELEDGSYYIEREYVEILTPEEQQHLVGLYDALEAHYSEDNMSDIFFGNITHPDPNFITERGDDHMYLEISHILQYFKEHSFILSDITCDMFGRVDGKLVVYDIA